MEEILFKEKQRFTQWWIWLLLAFLFVFLTPIIPRRETAGFGTEHNLDWIAGGIIIIVSLLFLISSLETKITEKGIYVRYIPFVPKTRFIPWEDLVSIKVRKYSALGEYGGWGWRIGFGGTAYNVKGNMGLQLIMKSGSDLLIGTQKPDELEEILKKLGKA